MLDITLFARSRSRRDGTARRGVVLDSARFERSNASAGHPDSHAGPAGEAQRAVEADRRRQSKRGCSALLAKSPVSARRQTARSRARARAPGVARLLLNLPNLAHASVPDGKSSEDNAEIRAGHAARFRFSVRDHTDSARSGLLDFPTAAKLAGARFSFLRGSLARLHRALAQFMLDTQTREHGYTECYTPYIVNARRVGTASCRVRGDMFSVRKAAAKAKARRSTSSRPPNHADQYVRGDIFRRRAADQVDRAFAVLPFGSGKLRQGHARHDPTAPVRQGRDGPDRRSGSVVRGFGGDDRSRRSDPAGSRIAVPRVACARATWASRARRPTTSKCGCPRRTPTARFRRARTARRSRRGGWRRAFATRKASPSSSTRSTARGRGGPRAGCGDGELQRADGGIDVPAVLQPYMGGMAVIPGR